MSRPTKLTPAVHAAIVASLRSGAYLETAAAGAGVSKTTVHSWLKRAEDEDDSGPPFVAFRRDVEEARAKAEMDAIHVVLAAAPQTWQAAAWYLERAFPARWGRRTVIETEPVSPENQPITLRGLHEMMRANRDTDED